MFLKVVFTLLLLEKMFYLYAIGLPHFQPHMALTTKQKYCGALLANILSQFCVTHNSPKDDGRSRRRRNIVEECCENPCTLEYMLKTYCRTVNSELIEELQREAAENSRHEYDRHLWYNSSNLKRELDKKRKREKQRMKRRRRNCTCPKYNQHSHEKDVVLERVQREVNGPSQDLETMQPKNIIIFNYN